MEIDNKKIVEQDPYFEEVKSKTNVSFDFVLWFYRILKYWYLFVISVAIFLGYAYLKNKSWVPEYVVGAKMILHSRDGGVLSGAIPTNTLLRSIENQIFVLTSYELTSRTVKNLPKRMHIDYSYQTRFRPYSFYTDTPIEVIVDSLERDIKPEAYNYVYTFTFIDQDKCEISYKENPNDEAQVSIIAPFDQEIDYKLFKIKLRKTAHFVPNIDGFKPDIKSFNFRFLSNDHLVGMFAGRVSAALHNNNSTVLSITMMGPDPARDNDYLNVLLNEIQDYNLALKNEQADQTIEYLDTQIKLFKDSSDMARVKLEEFQNATKVYDISSPILRYEMDSADREMEALAVRERTIRLYSEKINDNILESTELIEPTSLHLKTEDLITYVKEYNILVKKYKNLGSKNPIYAKTVEQLDYYRRKILEELQSIQVNQQDRKDALVRKYKTLKLRVENLPPQERELLRLEKDYKFFDAYFNFSVQRKMEADMQKASNLSDNYVYEYPRLLSGAINGGVIGKNYTFYLLIGLILPLAFVILKEELLNFKIATKEDCEKISGLPVIGAIENISKKLNNGAVLVKNYPKSSFAESFRNMRVRIEYMAQRENKITVLVTSTEPADGKTFIATNIASVYQLMGKKVIIVDLDLRRPSVAKTLQIDLQKGVSNYLIGQVTLDEIIYSHPDYGFDIIPAGTLPPNPSELIKTAKTKELLQHLKEIYDYVVIDCSPVGLVSDAYILSEIADTTLFVVRRAKTNKSFFKSVISQLKYDGVDNIALVFNDVKGREGYYGTSRYYGDKTYYLKKNSYYHDDYFEN